MASRTFSQSRKLVRFLNFLVEKALQGQAEQVNEYLIGAEVYERPASFDPQIDTIVRTEARRLRAKLRQYADGEGSYDSIVIDVPKGYVPVFRERDRGVLEKKVGQLVSRYRLSEKLGEGGMGAVYRAEDTVLGRAVALKFLSGSVLRDKERRARLVREARAAAAIDHPNVCTVYEIDEVEGQPFIAMAYVSGHNLEDQIARGPLELRDALDIACQLAGGLQAAHHGGVVHRDLKPANVIMSVVSNGVRAKIVDFGLAQLSAVSRLTAVSTPIGTDSYVSPEQMNGEVVDHRSDIWSLGVILYEMVTGKQPFRGERREAVFYAIAHLAPEPMSRLRAGVPEELERIVSKCLEKDAACRYSDAAELKAELSRLLHSLPDSGFASPVSLPEAPLETTSLPKQSSRWVALAAEESASGRQLAVRPSSQRGRLLRLIWVAGLLALLLVAAIVVWFLQSPRRTPGPELAAVPLTSYPGIEAFPSFSPDGSQVAFMWNGPDQDNFDIYVKLVGPGPSPLRLTSDPATDSGSAWSPDGRSVAFLRDLSGRRFAVWLVAPIGGPERKLAEISFPLAPLVSVTWSPDGRWLAVPDQETPNQPSAIFLLSPETNEKRRVTSPPSGLSDYGPAFSRDGRSLAFTRANTHLAIADLLVVSLSSSMASQGEPKLLMSHSNYFFGLTWSLDGREIIAVPGIGIRSGSLWRIAADGSGQRERVSFAGDENANLSLSRQAKRLAYSHGDFEDRNIWRLDFPGTGEQAGQAKRFIWSTRSDDSAQFSPDGTRIVFYSRRTGTGEIWVCNNDGTSAVQVTSLGEAGGSPRWSPDGEKIVFTAAPDGQSDIFMVGATGGKPRRLTNQPSNDGLSSWSGDGKWIYFRSDRSGAHQIWKMPAQGGEPVEVTGKGGWLALESPDGQFVYYTKSEEGTEGLWRLPVAGGEETQVIKSAIIRRAFSMTSDGIYFMTGKTSDSSYFTTHSVSATIQFYNFRTQQRKTVAKVVNPWFYLSVSPNGKSLLYCQNDLANNDLMLVENFR